MTTDLVFIVGLVAGSTLLIQSPLSNQNRFISLNTNSSQNHKTFSQNDQTLEEWITEY
jgi:hypothetical protein